MSSPLVVLIHGLGAPPYSLLPLQKYLNYHGYENVISVSHTYKSVNSSVLEVVDQIDSKLNDKQNLVIIGHSMGGIIGAKIAEGYAEKYNIKLLIMMASPVTGSSLAKFAISTQITGLKQISEWLFKNDPVYHDLSSPIAEPKCPYYTLSCTSWFTSFDGRLFEEETYINKENHTSFNIGHITIALWPPAWGKVKELIQLAH